MAYENGLVNLGYANSALGFNRLQEASASGPYSNNLYDEARPNNTYSTLQRETNTIRPRTQQSPNSYEEVGPDARSTQQRNKRRQKPSKKAGEKSRRDRQIRLVFMCLILVVASIALLLALLLMLGRIGPKCSCDSTVSFQDAEQLKSENELPQLITENTFQLNLSPLQETVKDLEANLTALQAEAEALMKESQNNRDVLQSAKTEYNSTKESVKSFSDRFLSNLTQIHENFHQQFDPDHGPVFAELRDLNESKSNQLNELEQRLDQENEGIDMTMESVNNTITDKVVVKISQPGPIGERGLTGPKGLRGDAGPIGAQGLKGSTGPVGLKGLKGDPGIDGFPGSPGSRGIDGEKGLKGDKGERGATGNQGPRGLTGEKGIGNFSWCQWKEATDPSPGDQAKAQDSVDVKIIAASCTTDGAQEYNLQVTPITNGHEYKCACQSIGLCILNYWECPTQAP